MVFLLTVRYRPDKVAVVAVVAIAFVGPHGAVPLREKL